jgi:ADP-ribose pyrophosphatase YjhB (NUDIX family)
MEHSWLIALKRLHALATSGLAFTDSDYEKDRYTEIQSLVSDLLSEFSRLQISDIDRALEHPEGGYQTPKLDVRAAVIQNNKILLVQEKTDSRWALPGGYADVGLSAAQNAVKEVWEEAGIRVGTSKLYAVRHKAKGKFKPDLRDFYKLYFLCDQCDDADLQAGSEVMEAEFFSLDELPELSTGRTIVDDLERAFQHFDDRHLPTFFDKE